MISTSSVPFTTKKPHSNQQLLNKNNYYGKPLNDVGGIKMMILNIKDKHICRIWGFHSGGYEEYHLLGYDAV
jgi:hypothetical protein